MHTVQGRVDERWRGRAREILGKGRFWRRFDWIGEEVMYEGGGRGYIEN